MVKGINAYTHDDGACRESSNSAVGQCFEHEARSG
jgi:hypothetical protein